MASLGAPAYSFTYNNQTSGISGGTRTISGLNFKMSETDDGITPAEWYQFFQTVIAGLGISLGTTQPSVTEKRIYEP